MNAFRSAMPTGKMGGNTSTLPSIGPIVKDSDRISPLCKDGRSAIISSPISSISPR